jgi:hypothetical protein
MSSTVTHRRRGRSIQEEDCSEDYLSSESEPAWQNWSVQFLWRTPLRRILGRLADWCVSRVYWSDNTMWHHIVGSQKMIVSILRGMVLVPIHLSPLLLTRLRRALGFTGNQNVV